MTKIYSISKMFEIEYLYNHFDFKLHNEFYCPIAICSCCKLKFSTSCYSRSFIYCDYQLYQGKVDVINFITENNCKYSLVCSKDKIT
jgi:hypothetical protein